MNQFEDDPKLLTGEKIDEILASLETERKNKAFQLMRISKVIVALTEYRLLIKQGSPAFLVGVIPPENLPSVEKEMGIKKAILRLLSAGYQLSVRQIYELLIKEGFPEKNLLPKIYTALNRMKGTLVHRSPNRRWAKVNEAAAGDHS